MPTIEVCVLHPQFKAKESEAQGRPLASQANKQERAGFEWMTGSKTHVQYTRAHRFPDNTKHVLCSSAHMPVSWEAPILTP